MWKQLNDCTSLWFRVLYINYENSFNRNKIIKLDSFVVCCCVYFLHAVCVYLSLSLLFIHSYFYFIITFQSVSHAQDFWVTSKNGKLCYKTSLCESETLYILYIIIFYFKRKVAKLLRWKKIWKTKLLNFTTTNILTFYFFNSWESLRSD